MSPEQCVGLTRVVLDGALPRGGGDGTTPADRRLTELVSQAGARALLQPAQMRRRLNMNALGPEIRYPHTSRSNSKTGPDRRPIRDVVRRPDSPINVC